MGITRLVSFIQSPPHPHPSLIFYAIARRILHSNDTCILHLASPKASLASCTQTPLPSFSQPLSQRHLYTHLNSSLAPCSSRVYLGLRTCKPGYFLTPFYLSTPELRHRDQHIKQALTPDKGEDTELWVR